MGKKYNMVTGDMVLYHVSLIQDLVCLCQKIGSSQGYFLYN